MLRKDGQGNWCLYSKDGKRKLKRFGKKKPSASAVAKEERRVQYFKHKGETEAEPVVEFMGDSEFFDVLAEGVGLRMRTPKTQELAEGDVGYIDVAMIEPGWGNQRDKHYYPRETLERDAGVFEGVKMFTTDHVEGEHNVRNWVSTVVEAGQRFAKDGSPIAKVAVHDSAFYEQLKNLKKLGQLDKMECSILAGGTARRATVDGEEANVVESITKAKAIDWVSKGGAGGHAMALVESEVGSLDLLTVKQLREARPDLVQEIAGTADNNQDDTDEEVNMDLEKRLKEAEDRIEELGKDNKTLVTALQETEEELGTALTETAKARAVSYLQEQAGEKELHPAVVKKLTRIITEGVWEADADVQSVVDSLIEEEVKYVNEFVPVDDGDDDTEEVDAKGKKDDEDGVLGISEFGFESDDDGKPVTLKEHSTALDSVLKKYIGIDTEAWTEAHYGD